MDCFQCGLASIHAQEEGEGEGEGEDIPKSEFDFDMSKFPGEVEATAPYQEFLEGILRKLGVDFGQGAWMLADMRSSRETKLQIRVEDKLYKGFLDLGIFPFDSGLNMGQLRLGFELKHTSMDKSQHRAVGGEFSSSSTASRPRGLKWTSRVKGQSIMEIVCLYRLCEWPLDLVVTDGAVYHILHLRGTSLMVMENVSAQKGLKYIAKSLLSKIDNSPSFKFAEHFEMFDEDERTARNTVRKDFTRGHVTATMWGQLAELAPFMDPPERLRTALEFMAEQRSAWYDLPLEIQSIYG